LRRWSTLAAFAAFTDPIYPPDIWIAEPSRNVGQGAIGKGILHLEYHQSREDVGSVLFIAGISI
jgi:hypothetical protein